MEEVRTMKEFLVQQKVHLVFGSGLLMILAYNIIMGFMAGETVLGATWTSITAIKPMDYTMFAMFWYSCAVPRTKDDWWSPLILSTFRGRISRSSLILGASEQRSLQLTTRHLLLMEGRKLAFNVISDRLSQCFSERSTNSPERTQPNKSNTS
jgi:hypothetical protein